MEKSSPHETSKKPSREHVSLLKWAQDESGRLLEYPTFQDSPKPTSLRAYESRAMTISERMRKTLVHDKRVNKDVLRLIEAKGDEGWAQNPDVLEGFFWEILHKGVDGNAIAMHYGVDVEAEGGYKGESYVEWYGMDDTDRMVKKEKRPVAGDKKEASKTLATMTSAPAKTEDIIDDDDRKRSNTGKRSAQRCKKRKRKVETCFADFPGPMCHVSNLNMEGLLRHMLRLPCEVNYSTFCVGHMFSRRRKGDCLSMASWALVHVGALWTQDTAPDTSEDRDDGRPNRDRDDCDGEFAGQHTGQFRCGATAGSTRSTGPSLFWGWGAVFRCSLSVKFERLRLGLDNRECEKEDEDEKDETNGERHGGLTRRDGMKGKSSWPGVLLVSEG